MHGSHSRNYVEPRERAGSGNGCPSESSKVIAVGMRDFLDEAKCAQPSELACHGSGGQVESGDQISPSPAVDVELAVLQGSQQRLVGVVEEVQPLD